MYVSVKIRLKALLIHSFPVCFYLDYQQNWLLDFNSLRAFIWALSFSPFLCRQFTCKNIWKMNENSLCLKIKLLVQFLRMYCNWVYAFSFDPTTWFVRHYLISCLFLCWGIHSSFFHSLSLSLELLAWNRERLSLLFFLCSCLFNCNLFVRILSDTSVCMLWFLFIK